MKYIDAERLKEILKSKINDRKRWMKDPAKSDRQDQLWSDLNGEDMSILKIIYILQEEQPEVNLDELINDFLLNNSEFLVERDSKVVVQKLARHFYELGQREMRYRITHPEYNAKVIEQLKSEYPVRKED